MSLLKLLEKELERDQEKSSITLGTPSRGGKLKVYFDADDPKEAESKIVDAVWVLQRAKTEYDTMQEEYDDTVGSDQAEE